MDNLETKTSTMASLALASGSSDSAKPKGRYLAQCRDADGNLKWEDEYDNLVTTQGKNDMLDKYLSGSSYTGTFYMGLISGTTGYGAGPVATDTAASHAGWAEAASVNAPTYSNGTRPYLAWSAASGAVKATSSTNTFTFSSAGVIKGSFLATNATKDSTAGVLLSAGLFSGGDKTVAINDSLTITYQLSM